MFSERLLVSLDELDVLISSQFAQSVLRDMEFSSVVESYVGCEPSLVLFEINDGQ